MGQYYYPLIISGNENPATILTSLYSHDYDNGLKLMEHSWLGNDFVSAVESLLTEKPQHLVWAGDYADNEQNHSQNLASIEEDYRVEGVKPRLNSLKKPIEVGYFIVNHTLKECVDVDKCVGGTGKEADWKIHPLPLLTVEGNGRGGGDYCGCNSYVGKWARHLIQIMDNAPEGYSEIEPNFQK